MADFGEPIGRVATLTRYPVKSMDGEQLTQARFGARGLDGDRNWAVYTEDGGIGSGKTSRRFRRVNGLLGLQARMDDDAAGGVPTIRFPDGAEHRADDPAAGAALSSLLGRPLRLAEESLVPHHDDCPVHLITTAAVRHLGKLIGEPIDGVTRFRANLVLEIDGTGFVEDDWSNRKLRLGEEVVLALGPGMPRCVMVGMPRPLDGLPTDGRLLKKLGQVHQTDFGLQAEVIRGGTVRPGDQATLLS